VARFDGATAVFRDVTVAPRVARRPRPPIWVGGNSRAAVLRAARLGDGWVPWELTADACAEAVALVRRTRAEAALPDAFDVIAPLSVATTASADDVLAAAAQWRAAGATAFHVGLAARSFEELLDRLAWFGRDVAPRVA
jgi:alkanesulfonate monooxygenase SsuD/methylene tetrahydromethanopterin reductase-like flavin-dependent oxidoreductase (luciferase family)